jgi:glycosyl transferase/beta-hydroxylase protein BlmF
MNKSIRDTVSNPENILVKFGIDMDDKDMSSYLGVMKGAKTEIFGNSTVGQIWNALVPDKIEDDDLVMMANDDQIWITKGWDKMLLEEFEKFPDKIVCMYADDGINGEKHCAFPIVSGKWIKTLGYFTPECFNFLYHDTWIMDIAKKIDRLHYIPDILIEHRHFSKDKKLWDNTYKKNRENKDKYNADGNIFKEKEENRKKDADKLKCLKY